MAFDNQYPNRKDKRRQYYDARKHARSCRAHGGCPWYQQNRSHRNQIAKQIATEKMIEYKEKG